MATQPKPAPAPKAPPKTQAQVNLERVRQAAVTSGIFKKIFSAGNSSLTTAQLLSMFKQICQVAGIQVPHDVLITLDTMQLLLAGGAVASDIAVGASLATTVGDSANAVYAGVQLMAELGLVDHTTADVIGLGVNAVLVVSSAGANVGADIGLMLSIMVCEMDYVASTEATDPQVLKAWVWNTVNKAVADYATKNLKPQYDHAADLLAQYKSGKLNYFDAIADVAIQAPYAFKGFFPGLASYFPSWITDTLTATASSTSQSEFNAFFTPYKVLMGADAQTAYTENATLVRQFSKVVTTKQQVESVLFNVVLAKPMQEFEKYFSVSNGISLHAMSVLLMVLSMLNPKQGAVSAGTDFSVFNICALLGLTPSILGDTWVFKGFLKNEAEPSDWKSTLPYPPLTEKYVPAPHTGGVIINGHVNLSANQATQKAAHDTLVAKQIAMQKLDEAGDMETLLQIPEARALLKRWATLRTPTPLAQSAAEKAVRDSIASVGAVAPKKIDFSDYWKGLSATQQMLKANLFSDEKSLILDFGDLDAILERVDRVYTFVLYKTLNRLALKSIAAGTGIPANRLQPRIASNGAVSYYDGGT